MSREDPQAFESCQFVEGYESVCQDVVAVEQLGSRMVAVLAVRKRKIRPPRTVYELLDNV
jgi:hypothetical protein